MPTVQRATPKDKAPRLRVPLVSAGSWDLNMQSPELFTMVVFYRGLHCPLCKKIFRKTE